tara:strand:+ start:2348 stop:3001 length:654 start_codon:yes stop_codon:yes gene_type:complete
MADHLILALETSSSICGAAIIKGRDCLALKEEEIPRKHAEILPLFVESVIYESGEEIKTINAVAVGIGPGSFTGLRIGLGFAKGFAFAQGLPILAVPTIEAMAFGLAKHQPTLGLVPSHGRRIFFQHFSWKDKLPNSASKPTVIDMEYLLNDLDKKATMFQWKCDDFIPKNLDFIAAVPSARWVGLLGSEKYDQLIIDKPYDLEPDYIAPFKVGIGK